MTYSSVQIVGIYFGFATRRGLSRLETHFPNEQKLHDRIMRVSFITVAIILITVKLD